MYKDLREFIELVDKLGALRRIEGADPRFEIGGLTEVAAGRPDGPALLFDAIKGLPRGVAYESADVPDNAYPDGKIADEAIRRLLRIPETDHPRRLPQVAAKVESRLMERIVDARTGAVRITVHRGLPHSVDAVSAKLTPRQAQL